MLRNKISYIFKLGKHRSLQLQPLRQLSAKTENSSATIPTSLAMRQALLKTKHSPNSNQMSS